MEEDFEDSKQVSDMLNKINIYGNEEIHESAVHEYAQESPTHDDDILKSFEIFKEPSNRFTPELKLYDVISP